ncbi:MAG: hypothetical protein R2772_03515 [Chitinophagales bacterium]
MFRGPSGSAGQLETVLPIFEDWMANTPGLKVISPSKSYDAKVY